jgi:hypothetical protein
MKKSKKIKILCLCVLPLFLFSSCDKYQLTGGISLHGIEKYTPVNSSVEISEYLLPRENYTDHNNYQEFLEKYPYIDGDYYYIDIEDWTRYQESALMYLIYDEETYEGAKQFSFSCYSFSAIYQYSYNGYEFLETLLLPEQKGALNEDGENKRFPYQFNFFSYNDQKKTLVFMGFYLGSNKTARDEELLTFSDMGAFLKEYYSFYDFDA